MSTADSSVRRVAILAIIAFLFGHFCFLALPEIFDSWNWRTVDRLYSIRWSTEWLRLPYDGTIVHVDVNDSSIRMLDDYFNRSDYARVTRNLASAGVAAQAFDFIFASRSNPGDDAAFAEALRGAANAYVGFAFRTVGRDAGRSPSSLPADPHMDATMWRLRVEGDAGSIPEGSNPFTTISEFSAASRATAFLNVRADRDGVYRRAPLILRYGGGFYPSLPFRVVCDYLQVTPDRITVAPGRFIRLSAARRPGEDAARDLTIPIDAEGNVLINFLGPWEAMQHYWFANIWRLSDDSMLLDAARTRLEGKIALVSDVATGFGDIDVTPTDPRMPGVALHANVLNTILSGRFLREATMRQMIGLEAALLAVLVLAAARFRSRLFTATSIAIAIAYVAFAAASFLFAGFIVNVVRPVMILFSATALVVAQRYIAEETQRRLLRRSFEAYFSPAVVDRILADPDAIMSSGDKKELTILFSDIQAFTTRSSTMQPDEVRTLLNAYFGAMVDITFRHGGTVDKFVGDGLMVFYGDPEIQPDHALRCVQSAIAMQQTIREMNRNWIDAGDPPIVVRIGINTGLVIVGNMGSPQRLSYTVLGSEVNVAQRLESNAPPGGILISQRTHELLVGTAVATVPRGEIYVKGLTAPVTVFEVLWENAVDTF